jgi:enoyl-CoA hydratase/carnithine racemase
VAVEGRGPVALIRLQRPDVHNVVDEAVMEALEMAVARLDQAYDVRAVVLTGAGSRTFCAGGDLRYFSTLGSRDDAREMSQRMQRIVAGLADGPRILVTAANGNAWGGGCELLVAGQIRIASKTATFQFRQVSMGVVTGWGGGLRLFRALGPDQARRLLVSGDVLDAREALRIGLVHRLVEPHVVESHALAVAQEIATQPPAAVAAFRELHGLYHDGDMEGFRRRELELFGELWTGEVFREKLRAFVDKRIEN